MTADVSQGPLSLYRARVAAGALRADPAQARAAETLQDLWRRLRGYDPRPEAAKEEPGLLARFFRRKHVDEQPGGPPLGLYLVGEVGRGKSMLMDLFFEAADVPRKKREHFHAFMQKCHRRIHEWPTASWPRPRCSASTSSRCMTSSMP
jgi:cell division protein ZapE